MSQPSTLKERILQYAQVHLGAEPEHLWAKFPRYAVLRHSGSAKWFAAFLEVPGTRLGLERPESVDILDVKCGPLLAGSLLGTPGILPAYHMNKSNWVTLLLDGSLPEEEIDPPAGAQLRSDEAGRPASRAVEGGVTAPTASAESPA